MDIGTVDLDLDIDRDKGTDIDIDTDRQMDRQIDRFIDRYIDRRSLRVVISNGIACRNPSSTFSLLLVIRPGVAVGLVGDGVHQQECLPGNYEDLRVEDGPKSKRLRRFSQSLRPRNQG